MLCWFRLDKIALKSNFFGYNLPFHDFYFWVLYCGAWNFLSIAVKNISLMVFSLIKINSSFAEKNALTRDLYLILVGKIVVFFVCFTHDLYLNFIFPHGSFSRCLFTKYLICGHNSVNFTNVCSHRLMNSSP